MALTPGYTRPSPVCSALSRRPTDPELYEILQNQIFGEVFATGVLTDVERELLTVTVLAAMQTLPQLAAHVKAALNTGATPLQGRRGHLPVRPVHRLPQDAQRRRRQRGFHGRRR